MGSNPTLSASLAGKFSAGRYGRTLWLDGLDVLIVRRTCIQILERDGVSP
ncbi:MAG: hypothetical protein V1782_07085 [Pseudomonadota bacterium]